MNQDSNSGYLKIAIPTILLPGTNSFPFGHIEDWYQISILAMGILADYG